MANILCVGVVALDTIISVHSYPQEDTEIFADKGEQRIGGNAANTAGVLAQHGHKVSLLSVLPKDLEGRTIEKLLKDSSIDYGFCERDRDITPNPIILLSKESGSRTIIHYRDFPQIYSSSFPTEKQFDWIHFELTDISETHEMILKAKKCNPNSRISLELEKYKRGSFELIKHVDIAFCSKDFVNAMGYKNPEIFLEQEASLDSPSVVSCTWGSNGAYVLNNKGDVVHYLPRVTEKIVDTIGAGDVYNAGFINSMINIFDARSAVKYASELAVRKIVQHGFNGIVKNRITKP